MGVGPDNVAAVASTTVGDASPAARDMLLLQASGQGDQTPSIFNGASLLQGIEVRGSDVAAHAN